VPSQQVKPIASARQRARVAEHEIPQVHADRLESLAFAVHDRERQVGRLAIDYRTDRLDSPVPYQNSRDGSELLSWRAAL
jgi:hypothetical protein